MRSQMELLALATLHEFQNSLVFQSVFLSEGRNKEVKSKFPHKERFFHHFHIKVPTLETRMGCESVEGETL
jgi:hypothetical protein